MKEIELLQTLVKLEAELQDLEIRLRIYYDAPDRTRQLEKDVSQTRAKIHDLEKALVEIENHSDSKMAKSLMMRQLSAYIQQTNKASQGLRLSRNQGLVIDNYLFSGILRDLQHILNGSNLGFHIPHLLYTYEEEGAVAIGELKEFLVKEIQNLEAIKEVNYIKLRDFFEEFKQRLTARFISDN